MAKDFYIQRNAADPVLSSDQVLALAQTHVPAATQVSSVDETGGEARTYMVETNLVVKVQRPQQLRPRTSLAKERFCLSRLVDVAGLNVPKVLGGGCQDGIEYTVMTRMPGDAILSTPALTGIARDQALQDLGRMLRLLHNLPQSPLFDAHLIPGDHTPAESRWRMGELFEDAARAVADSGVAWPLPVSPNEVLQRAMRMLPNEHCVAALHSNPGPEHVFVDPQSLKLTGIIDFGDAYFGHPVHDLRRFRAPRDRANVFAGYQSSGSVDAAFQQTWLVASMLADMLAVVHAPEHRAAALLSLQQLI